jgi:hypothetical protein
MILKIIIILGGLAIIGSMIYDRFTGKRTTRRILWPLVGSVAAIFIALAVRNFLD